MNAVRLRHALRFAFHQRRTSGRRDDRPPSFSDLLPGRDLADIATVVLGNNRNLMLAPGGLLEHLPAGEPSYCLGPGPLYLPLGHRTRPELPPSARHALFGQDERHAVVLLPDHAYVFYLATRRPAWSLWIGDAPVAPVPAATMSVKEV